ncbi:MAG: hypothetical protein FWF47_01310 [Clostridia bacterium]|nr:hypothetical protein [Clostridia bacterium]
MGAVETGKKPTPKKKVKPIHKPYSKGRLWDKASLKRATSVLGLVFISMFVYLITGSLLLSSGSLFIRVILCFVFTGLFAFIAYTNGINAGFQDVTFSEIAYQRQEGGKQFTDDEAAKCYHPMKGVVSAVAGVAPFFLLAVILSITTQPQYFVKSALPGWLASLERRTEIGNALRFYHQNDPWQVTDVIRVIIRMIIMPFITLAGGEDIWLAATIERLSPLLVLILPAGYAIGYLGGPDARAKMHAGIAASIRKRRRREKKRVEQRRREPEQLV